MKGEGKSNQEILKTFERQQKFEEQEAMNDEQEYLFAPYLPMGPPCHNPKCSGVLEDCANWNDGVFFRRCTICQTETDRQTIEDKWLETEETIRAAMKDQAK